MDNQPMHLEVFYSYACRDTYAVFKWLRRVQASGVPLDITWRPFAIQQDDPHADWARPWADANSELRGFMAAEAARQQGAPAFRRFHDALEAAVHAEFLELGDEETLIGAAEQAELDVERFRSALQAPADLARAAQRSHARAEEAFGVFGTPTLVFPNGQAIHVELAAIPAARDARVLFEAVTALAIEQPYVGQLKRTTPLPARLAA